MFNMTAKTDDVSYSLVIANPCDPLIHDPLIRNPLNTYAHAQLTNNYTF